MKIKRSHAYFASVVTLLGLSLPFLVSAQQQVIFAGTTFCSYMRNVFNFATGIVGTLTVVMIIVGGVLYATAGGNSERVSRAKDVIVASIVGMVLVLGSYLLFNTLSPNLLQCNENLPAGTGVPGTVGGIKGGKVFPLDTSNTDICQGKTPVSTKEDCEKTNGANSCLKGKNGWCKSECGNGAAALSAFQSMKGTCFITNHCAFTATRALVKSGCPDFRKRTSTLGTAQQLTAWGFKKYDYNASNPTQSLANIKPGAILIFKGHTAMYVGNNKMIDATPGWHSQCGLSGDMRFYKNLVGKNAACTRKNPYPKRNPNSPPDQIYKGFTKNGSKVQCIAEHSFKNGKPYSPTKYPLLAYYQRD